MPRNAKGVALPRENWIVVVKTEGYGTHVGTVTGTCRGRRSGSWFDRQEKLILVDPPDGCSHVAVDSITEVVRCA